MRRVITWLTAQDYEKRVADAKAAADARKEKAAARAAELAEKAKAHEEELKAKRVCSRSC